MQVDNSHLYAGLSETGRRMLSYITCQGIYQSVAILPAKLILRAIEEGEYVSDNTEFSQHVPEIIDSAVKIAEDLERDYIKFVDPSEAEPTEADIEAVKAAFTERVMDVLYDELESL